MEMTKEEIIRDYRQARYKGKQVGILADLNGCRKSEIVAILRERGVPVKALPRNRAKPSQEGKKTAQERTEPTDGAIALPEPQKHAHVLNLALSDYLAKQQRLLETREQETERELAGIRATIQEAKTALAALAAKGGEGNADG